MKILVTGGAGFIGSHVAEMYLSEGHEVVVVDNLSSGKRENVPPGAIFYRMDVRSDGMEALFERERPHVLNHHAAQKSVPKSVADPHFDAEVNIGGTLRLLDLCVRYNVQRFLFASTGGALADEKGLIPTPETARPVMQSPYAVSKYAVEQYLRMYRERHGLEFVVLRYANVYGPRQVPEGECGVIPIFMARAAEGLPSKLYRYDDMPKGTTRDYVYVEDVCRANLLALDRGEGEEFHIGGGRETYIADIYEAVCRAMGNHPPLLYESFRPADLRRSALDCTKAKQLLGWEPAVGLEEGLRLTTAWYMDTKGQLGAAQ